MNDLSSRYALALFSLKKEKDTLIASQEEVKELINILQENEEYIRILSSRYLSKKERMEMIGNALLDVDEDIVNLLKIVIDNDRSKYIIDILQQFSSYVNEYRNIKEGLVYTSEKLSEVQKKDIETSISSKEGCPCELKMIIDPSLIGGVKVVINNHIYDGSIKHHLEKMKQTLIK